MEINLRPIGLVRNDITEPKRESRKEAVSQIVINDDLVEALHKIDDFSHIIVIYWMHKLPPSQRSVTKVHPRGNDELPLVGVFASRSPARPNPLGITTVKLLERRGNILKVSGMDAVNGTPVLDIKPYIPDHDANTEIKTPGWLTK